MLSTEESEVRFETCAMTMGLTLHSKTASYR